MKQNVDLPRGLRDLAIEFAQEATGVRRPVRAHRVHILAFEACYEYLVQNGMIKEEFLNGKDEENQGRSTEEIHEGRSSVGTGDSSF